MTDPFNADTDTKTQGTTNPASPTDPFVDKLMAIKNERGEPKYKTVEDALDALAASQQFIETLKTEKRTVQEQLEAEKAERQKLGSIDDFVKKLNPNAPTVPKVETPTQQTGLSEERVAELLNSALQKREQSEAQKRNVESVVSKLSEEHGDKAPEFIKQRAIELNTTPEQLKQLAAQNPVMALTLLSGAKKTTSSPSQPFLNKAPDNKQDTSQIPKNLARGGVSNKQLAEAFSK